MAADLETGRGWAEGERVEEYSFSLKGKHSLPVSLAVGLRQGLPWPARSSPDETGLKAHRDLPPECCQERCELPCLEVVPARELATQPVVHPLARSFPLLGLYCHSLSVPETPNSAVELIYLGASLSCH